MACFRGVKLLVLHAPGFNVPGHSKALAFSIAASPMGMIYALGSVSGAHNNPAVTAAITASGRGKIEGGARSQGRGAGLACRLREKVVIHVPHRLCLWGRFLEGGCCAGGRNLGTPRNDPQGSGIFRKTRPWPSSSLTIITKSGPRKAAGKWPHFFAMFGYRGSPFPCPPPGPP